VIYQRLAALPRIRWATSAVVIPDQGTRVHTLATGSLPRSTVVLDAPGPAAGGAPATVKVNEDGADEISVGVSAQGAGYLVVADADQVGWGVTVDGKKAELVAADEGVVAVAVPAGTHTVALHYSSPDGGLGAAISVVTAVALLAAVGGEVWWSRRRRQPAGVIGGGPVVSAASDEAGADPVADPVADPAADPRPEQDADALRGLIREAGSDDKSSTGLREPPLDGPERSGAPPG
jgi:hypothetical protein